MDGKNMNNLMKEDPSLEKGKWVRCFERKCNVEMKIIEPSIVQMVNEEISNTEELLFKILVRGKEFEHTSISKLNLESSPQSERIA